MSGDRDRPSVGDPVETKSASFCERTGEMIEVWTPATVCYSGLGVVGVAYAGGERKAFMWPSHEIRRPSQPSGAVP